MEFASSPSTHTPPPLLNCASFPIHPGHLVVKSLELGLASAAVIALEEDYHFAAYLAQEPYEFVQAMS